VDELKSKMSAKSMKKRLTKGTDFNMPPESVLVMEFTGLEDRSDGPEGIED
jgi:hypothetical protein